MKDFIWFEYLLKNGEYSVIQKREKRAFHFVSLREERNEAY